MITIRLLLFAWVKEALGQGAVAHTLDDGSTVSDLRAALTTLLDKRQHASASAHSLSHCVFAVDNNYVDDAFVLSSNMEVVVIPAVSGG